MADNFSFTEGAGKTGAADEIGGVLYPRVKIAQGADGIATDVSSAAPLHTTVADGNSATLGSKADAKNTAADTTAISVVSTLKQISASIQAAAASLAGTLTVATHAVTQSGTWTVQPGNTANTTAWKVDGSAVTQPVSGTVTASIAAGATTIAKAEDVASADADVGVPAMAVRKATPANTSGTDGDYEMLQMSAGRLWVSAILEAGANAIGKLAANAGVTIGAVEIS
jgi:hypothetical protein